jgi:hypothetical protein
MKLGALLIAVGLPSMACDSTPRSKGLLDGSADGYVYATAPVAGAIVHAFAVGPDGVKGNELGQSDPTTPDGHFRVSLGIYQGPVEFIAQTPPGPAPTYTEPTGEAVTWAAGDELHGFFVTGDAGTRRFGIIAGEQVSVVVTPMSDWAISYARGRLDHQMSPNVNDALEKAVDLFVQHVGYPFWSTVPADLTASQMRAVDDAAVAGAELGGFSLLSQNMASEIGASGIGTMRLIDLLRRDARGGQRPMAAHDTPQLDGYDIHGQLSLGTCPIPASTGGCRYSPLSSRTLRLQWKESIQEFLSPTTASAAMLNHSGIEAAALRDILGNISANSDELFPDPGDRSDDFAPPAVTVVATTMTDETNMTAEISGSGVGTVEYPLPNTMPVSFDGVNVPTFSKYATRYVVGSPNLPEFHFSVLDNQTTPESIHVTAHIFLEDQGQFVDVGSQDVRFVQGAGFNRSVTVTWSISDGDGGLSPIVGLRSGHYRLDVHAFDEALNETVRSVEWQQTILPPPVRQRNLVDPSDLYTSGACACGDPACPEHYILSRASEQCLASQALGAGFVPISVGDDLGSLIEGGAALDNPNPVPVRVRFRGTVIANWRRATVWAHPVVPAGLGAMESCANPGANESNCYDATAAPTTEVVLAGQTSSDLFSGVNVIATSEALSHCPTCAADEWEIPPMTSVSIQVMGRPFSFVLPGAQQLSAGNLSNVTGQPGPFWRECSQVTCVPQGSPNCNITCTATIFHRALHYLTRVHLETVPTISVDARPSAPPGGVVSDAESSVLARGTAQPFVYDLVRWWTAQDPYPLPF